MVPGKGRARPLRCSPPPPHRRWFSPARFLICGHRRTGFSAPVPGGRRSRCRGKARVLREEMWGQEATSCHPFDRNLLSRYKVYFGGHTDFGSECMLLGHYACSSLLQRPAELSTPVKENTSGHPGRGRLRMCSPNSYVWG